MGEFRVDLRVLNDGEVGRDCGEDGPDEPREEGCFGDDGLDEPREDECFGDEGGDRDFPKSASCCSKLTQLLTLELCA